MRYLIGFVLLLVSQPAANLSGETNWGTLTQTGTAITINGHASWYAIGQVRPDGKVQLVWTLNDNSRAGIGVYSIDGTSLRGVWGWGDEVSLDAQGGLAGQTRGDTTYRIKPDS